MLVYLQVMFKIVKKVKLGFRILQVIKLSIKEANT